MRLAPEPAAIFAITTYESFAVSTGLVPTISTGLKALPRPVRALIVVCAAYWLLDHVEVV